jgi:hypothetical protein
MIPARRKFYLAVWAQLLVLAVAREVSARPFSEGHFLCGQVRTGIWRRTSPGELRVEYGIESWFVPEGIGRAIETRVRKGELVAHIAVAASGEAILKELEL